MICRDIRSFIWGFSPLLVYLSAVKVILKILSERGISLK